MVTTIDKYGRIIIPKKYRELLGITSDTHLRLSEDGKRIIIEPLESKQALVESDGLLIYAGNLLSDPEGLIEIDRNMRINSLSREK